MNSGIYLIMNLRNSKRYVGSTLDLENRKRQHFNDLRNNCHRNDHLQKAWNKYGEESFVFIPFIRCPPDELLELEQCFLDMMDGYNISQNACATQRGLKRTAETKAKIGKASAARRHSAETRERMRQSRLGRKHSQAVKDKIGQSRLGQKHTPEAIVKMKIGRKATWLRNKQAKESD